MSPKRGAPSPVKGRKFDRTVYTDAEVQDLLQRTSSDAASAIRNYALIAALWQSGLRISEALDLRRKDYDPVTHELGKRRIRLGPEASRAIDRWLTLRDRIGVPKRGPLFCTLRGKRLQGTQIRTTLMRLAARAGWTKRAHPGGFRQTFAVNRYNAGVSTEELQRQLGHSTLTTTKNYLRDILGEEYLDR